jgi:hypothetical protein
MHDSGSRTQHPEFAANGFETRRWYRVFQGAEPRIREFSQPPGASIMQRCLALRMQYLGDLPHLSSAYIMLELESFQVRRKLLLHTKLADVFGLAEERGLPVRGPGPNRLELGLRTWFTN